MGRNTTGEPHMFDQAAELRNLVSQAARDKSRMLGACPRLVVFSGGKGGVGVSTLAIHIAMALVDQGLRVVLVDADLYRADIAPLCNLPERGHVGDILSARRDIHEVLERGPGGILVVPGVWAPDHEIPFSQHAQHRLVKQIQSLGRHADIVLTDVGSASVDAVHRFWLAADEVVLVTTPDSVSVMDCYATIKTALGCGAAPEAVRLIINKAASQAEADEVFHRIEQSARRFLQRQVTSLGYLPNDAAAIRTLVERTSIVMTAPNGPIAEALQAMAAILAAATVGTNKSAA